MGPDHVYYRCTCGKGDCSQRTYVREEVLLDQVAEVLGINGGG